MRQLHESRNSGPLSEGFPASVLLGFSGTAFGLKDAGFCTREEEPECP